MDKTPRVVEWINVDKIYRLKHSVQRFVYEDIHPMVASVQSFGIISPILLRRLNNGRYEVIDGTRRLHAAILCGIKKIPSVVLSCTEEEAFMFHIHMHCNVKPVHYLEKAFFYEKSFTDATDEEAAKIFHISEEEIRNKRQITKLSEESRSLLITNEINEVVAISLLALEEKKRKRVLDNIIANHMDTRGAVQYIQNIVQNGHSENLSGVHQLVRKALTKASTLAEREGLCVQMKEQVQNGEITFLFRVKIEK